MKPGPHLFGILFAEYLNELASLSASGLEVPDLWSIMASTRQNDDAFSLLQYSTARCYRAPNVTLE